MKADRSFVLSSRRVLQASAVLLPTLLYGCGQKATEVKLTPAKSTIYGLKSKSILQIEVRDKKGEAVPGLLPKLSSSNVKVATVEDTGVVKAVGPGKTVITASVEKLSGTASIEVIDIAQIAIQPGRTTLAGPKGSKLNYTATVKDSTGKVVGNVPKWTSSDPNVASISNGGEVESLTEGRTTITATLGDMAGFSDLAVVFRTIASFEVSPKQLILKVGEVQRITPSVKDPKGVSIDEAAIVWTTSDPRIASCVGNNVTGHAQGTATIHAVCGPLSTDLSVIVN